MNLPKHYTISIGTDLLFKLGISFTGLATSWLPLLADQPEVINDEAFQANNSPALRLR